MEPFSNNKHPYPSFPSSIFAKTRFFETPSMTITMTTCMTIPKCRNDDEMWEDKESPSLCPLMTPDTTPGLAAAITVQHPSSNLGYPREQRGAGGVWLKEACPHWSPWSK